MRTKLHTLALSLLGVLSYARVAQADPPVLRAEGSLRDGLRVDACRGHGRCDTWVRFPARPYREFVEARMSPSGRFFYVWSKPDGRPREIDVFATPQREGQLANRRGHWSPGAGGSIAWVANDRLWHAWGCGANCTISQLYTATGRTVFSAYGEEQRVSPDGRFAVVATLREGQFVDIAHGTTRPFHAPPGQSYARNVTWNNERATVWFAPDDRSVARSDENPLNVRIALPRDVAVAPAPAPTPAPAVAVARPRPRLQRAAVAPRAFAARSHRAR